MRARRKKDKTKNNNKSFILRGDFVVLGGLLSIMGK
jgi:hypothetical protein